MVRGAESFSDVNPPTLKSVIKFTRKTKYALSRFYELKILCKCNKRIKQKLRKKEIAASNCKEQA